MVEVLEVRYTPDAASWVLALCLPSLRPAKATRSIRSASTADIRARRLFPHFAYEIVFDVGYGGALHLLGRQR